DDVPHRNDVELGAGSGFTQTIEAVKGVKSLSLTRGFSGICVGLDSRCLHTVFPGNLAELAIEMTRRVRESSTFSGGCPLCVHAPAVLKPMLPKSLSVCPRSSADQGILKPHSPILIGLDPFFFTMMFFCTNLVISPKI